ncbi:hypothetical protein [Dactylosporangium sp. NPDC000521]|uniref:hypothetical protein n=1 Tax=Dactylosporangium sp. NPDC000521 TaxID=3363975 RepID=UPI0036C4788A
MQYDIRYHDPATSSSPPPSTPTSSSSAPMAAAATAPHCCSITLATPGGIAFPHAEQAVRITRTRITAGRTSRETAYLTVSLPAADAQPADLQHWIRRAWHIENRPHHVRDVTFREDQHQARTGTGPAVIATLRNTAIGYHRTSNATNVACATRRAGRRSHDLIDAVTSSYPTNAMTLRVRMST